MESDESEWGLTCYSKCEYEIRNPADVHMIPFSAAVKSTASQRQINEPLVAGFCRRYTQSEVVEQIVLNFWCIDIIKIHLRKDFESSYEPDDDWGTELGITYAFDPQSENQKSVYIGIWGELDGPNDMGSWEDFNRSANVTFIIPAPSSKFGGFGPNLL